MKMAFNRQDFLIRQLIHVQNELYEIISSLTIKY